MATCISCNSSLKSHVDFVTRTRSLYCQQSTCSRYGLITVVWNEQSETPEPTIILKPKEDW